MALFCCLLGLIGGVLSKTSVGRMYGVVIAITAALAAVASLSRIGLILFVLIAICFWPVRYAFTFAAAAAAFIYFIFGDEFVLAFFRITTDGTADVSSLAHRLELRQHAIANAFDDFFGFLFGFGPSKTAAENVYLPIPDHSLRHPDSSLTLILFRYGVIGLAAFVAMVATAYPWRRSLQERWNAFPVIVLLGFAGVAASLDPVFHDPKVLLYFLIAAHLTTSDSLRIGLWRRPRS
jgi:O-antigen ligase